MVQFNDEADLIERLASDSKSFSPDGGDIERSCWMVIHRYVHGMLPSEYDVREVPEELYLAVLSARRSMNT